MPVRVKNPLTTGGSAYGSPFVGPVQYTAQIAVNIANLTTAEVDAQGYIKPGVPLTRAGILVGIAPAFVFGVTIEAIKLVASNAVGDRVGTFDIAVCTMGQVNQDTVEDMLARALTADEIAGFDRAGSKLVLVT